MNKKKELELIKIQEIASFLFIVTTIVSLILTYNRDLNLQKKKVIFNQKETYVISCFNRLVIFIILLAFLFISIENKKIVKRKGQNTMFASLEILASIFSILAGIIILYTVIYNPNRNSLTNSENPNV